MTIPEQAVQAMPERIFLGCADTDNEHQVWADEGEGGTEYVRADLAAPHLAAVRVKKLEWKTERADNMNGVDTERNGFHEFGYYSITGKNSGCFVSTFDNMGRVRHVDMRGFGSIEAAKAAAQADYEARILSALEPSAGRAAVLEDAARLDAATAALISLTEAGIPTDVQELLIVGDPSRGIAPGSLSKAIAAVIRALASHPVADKPDEAGAQGEGWLPTVCVGEMQTSAGADYYVCVKVGDREITPHMFKERWKAEYEVAEWQWLFNGGEKPDLLAYGPLPTPPSGEVA